MDNTDNIIFSGKSLLIKDIWKVRVIHIKGDKATCPSKPSKVAFNQWQRAAAHVFTLANTELSNRISATVKEAESTVGLWYLLGIGSKHPNLQVPKKPQENSKCYT